MNAGEVGPAEIERIVEVGRVAGPVPGEAGQYEVELHRLRGRVIRQVPD